MLAYATRRRTPRQLSPSTLLVIVGVHAIALVMVAAAKPLALMVSMAARRIASPSRPFCRIHRSLPELALVDLAKIFASMAKTDRPAATCDAC